MRHFPLRLWSCLVTLACALAYPSVGHGQDTCDVVVSLDEVSPLPVAAYGLDYGSAGGSFVGSGFTPACTRLFVGNENTIYDDDAGLLSNFVASQGGIPPAQALISCVFALDGGFPCPSSSDFVVTDPEFPPIFGSEWQDVFPNPPPPPSLAIVVTPRTPVCGDGFREGTEECDDGNVVEGDCCSSTCVLDAAGTPCVDGSVCTLNESCDNAGSCVPDSILSCNDGDPCTTDSCDPISGCASALAPAPHTQCAYDHRGSLDLRDPPSSTKRKLGWLMVSRIATTTAAVGNPTVDTDYALCIYDEVGSVAALAARIDVPAGANWQAISPSGTRFQYKDPTRSVNGVDRLRIDGKNGGIKLQLKAAGGGLPLPGPIAPDRYFAQDNVVFVQLRNTAGGCWSIGYGAAVENSSARFKAKSK